MYLVQRLQSVMSNAARLICSSSRYDHVSPLLHQLHWLKAPQQIDVQLTVLHELAAAYHAGEHLTANSVNVYDHVEMNMVERAFPPSVTGYYRLLPRVPSVPAGTVRFITSHRHPLYSLYYRPSYRNTFEYLRPLWTSPTLLATLASSLTNISPFLTKFSSVSNYCNFIIFLNFAVSALISTPL